MFLLSDIAELQLHGIYDRKVPGAERVVLRAWNYSSVPLGRFFVIVGMQHTEGGATPLYDNFCWLGETVLNPGQWLFLYTGRGHDTDYKIDDGSVLRMHYWNQQNVVFTMPHFIPLLLRTDGVSCGRSPDYVIAAQPDTMKKLPGA